jgi:upstream activation factor subunit UAF30
MPTKTREKKASAGKTNALQKPLQPSEELAAVVGSNPLPRGQVVSKMWEYIRAHNLQNPENRREILADDKLRRVFGKDKVTMFEMNKHLAGHLKWPLLTSTTTRVFAPAGPIDLIGSKARAALPGAIAAPFSSRGAMATERSRV